MYLMYLCVSQNWRSWEIKDEYKESSVYLQGVTRCRVFFPWLPSFEERNGSNCHIILKFICLFVLCHQNGDPEKHICKAGFFLSISGFWFRMWSYPSLPWPFLCHMFLSVSVIFIPYFLFVIAQSHEIFCFGVLLEMPPAFPWILLTFSVNISYSQELRSNHMNLPLKMICDT